MQPNRRIRATGYSRQPDSSISKFTAFLMILFFGMCMWVFRINEGLNESEKENAALKAELESKTAQINILQCMFDSVKAPIEPKTEEVKIVKVKKQKKDTASAAIKNIDTTGIIINVMNPAKEISDTLK